MIERLGGEEFYLQSDHGRALNYNLVVQEKRLRSLIRRNVQHQNELRGIIKNKREEMIQKLFYNNTGFQKREKPQEQSNVHQKDSFPEQKFKSAADYLKKENLIAEYNL